MSVPGVGPIVALTYAAAIDDPARFKSSKTVGAHFGMTPTKYQSRETDRTGRISKIGDSSVRTISVRTSSVLTVSVRTSWVRKTSNRSGSRASPATTILPSEG